MVANAAGTSEIFINMTIKLMMMYEIAICGHDSAGRIGNSFNAAENHGTHHEHENQASDPPGNACVIGQNLGYGVRLNRISKTKTGRCTK